MMLPPLPEIIAFAIGTFVAAADPKWVTYQSPSAFYSVEHPSDWKVERDENIVNIVSAYIGEPAPGDAERIISEAFAAQEPTSPLLAVTGSGWKGVRRTFLDKSSTPNHDLVVIVATSAAGMVILTWNERSPGLA